MEPNLNLEIISPNGIKFQSIHCGVNREIVEILEAQDINWTVVRLEEGLSITDDIDVYTVPPGGLIFILVMEQDYDKTKELIGDLQ